MYKEYKLGKIDSTLIKAFWVLFGYVLNFRSLRRVAEMSKYLPISTFRQFLKFWHLLFVLIRLQLSISIFNAVVRKAKALEILNTKICIKKIVS